MISILRKSAYKYGYLFIGAAWVYTVSFLFTNYFSFDSSPEKVANVLTKHISRQERHFTTLLKDTSWIKKVVAGKAKVERPELQSDATGIFAYRIVNSGVPVQVFWNTNTMTVSDADLQKPDG